MTDLKPRFPIRRFDVFADYHYLKNLEHGMADNVARGRGVWAAKVVAGRRHGAAPPPSSGRGTGGRGSAAEGKEEDEGEFRSVGGELQTDRTFDKEIVDRMGKDFYETVFHPAIEAAVAEGKRYEDIRDEIRKDWKRS